MAAALSVVARVSPGKAAPSRLGRSPDPVPPVAWGGDRCVLHAIGQEHQKSLPGVGGQSSYRPFRKSNRSLSSRTPTAPRRERDKYEAANGAELNGRHCSVFVSHGATRRCRWHDSTRHHNPLSSTSDTIRACSPDTRRSADSKRFAGLITLRPVGHPAWPDDTTATSRSSTVAASRPRSASAFPPSRDGPGAGRPPHFHARLRGPAEDCTLPLT